MAADSRGFPRIEQKSRQIRVNRVDPRQVPHRELQTIFNRRPSHVRPKSTFALFLGNRGLFPASLISGARAELISTLNGLGHEVIALDADATRYGAVETIQEAAKFAAFLEENRGRYDGVILSLPNFGDENGGVAALQDAGVPIYIQAYPDDMDKMSPDLRRDSFCGKLSMMDVFYQNDLKFTTLKPHVVSPASPRFVQNIDHFDRVCRVVKGLRRMRVGALGARTTAFKTVRVDEVALQRHGITVETLDLSDVFARVRKVSAESPAYQGQGRQAARLRLVRRRARGADGQPGAPGRGAG